MRFLTSHRFNFIDLVTAVIASSYFEHSIIASIVISVIGAVVSIIATAKVSK